MQFGTYAHLAFTAHITCAEHGELIEVGGGRRSVMADERRTESTLGDPSGEATRGHEHCAAVPQRRAHATEAFFRAVAVTAQLPFVARVVVDNGPPAPIDLIFLAPKNSPPLA